MSSENERARVVVLMTQDELARYMEAVKPDRGHWDETNARNVERLCAPVE